MLEYSDDEAVGVGDLSPHDNEQVLELGDDIQVDGILADDILADVLEDDNLALEETLSPEHDPLPYLVYRPANEWVPWVYQLYEFHPLQDPYDEAYQLLTCAEQASCEE